MPGFNKSYQTRFRKRCQKTQKAQKPVSKVKQTGSGSKNVFVERNLYVNLRSIGYENGLEFGIN